MPLDEHPPDQFAGIRFVIDHEHFHAAKLRRFTRFFGRRQPVARVNRVRDLIARRPQRQIDSECRSRAFAAAGRADSAAMKLDQAFHQRQADPEPAVLSSQ